MWTLKFLISSNEHRSHTLRAPLFQYIVILHILGSMCSDGFKIIIINKLGDLRLIKEYLEHAMHKCILQKNESFFDF